MPSVELRDILISQTVLRFVTVLTSRRLHIYLYSAVDGNHPYLLFTLCYCRSLSLAFCTPTCRTCLFILNFPVQFLCLSQNPSRKDPNIKLKSRRTSSILLRWLFVSQQPLHLSVFFCFYTNCGAVKYLCFHKSNYLANILLKISLSHENNYPT